MCMQRKILEQVVCRFVWHGPAWVMFFNVFLIILRKHWCKKLLHATLPALSYTILWFVKCRRDGEKIWGLWIRRTWGRGLQFGPDASVSALTFVAIELQQGLPCQLTIGSSLWPWGMWFRFWPMKNRLLSSIACLLKDTVPWRLWMCSFCMVVSMHYNTGVLCVLLYTW